MTHTEAPTATYVLFAADRTRVVTTALHAMRVDIVAVTSDDTHTHVVANGPEQTDRAHAALTAFGFTPEPLPGAWAVPADQITA